MIAAFVFYIVQVIIILSTKHFTVKKPLIFNVVVCLPVCLHWGVSLFLLTKKRQSNNEKTKEELHNMEREMFWRGTFCFISSHCLQIVVQLSTGVSHSPDRLQWRIDVKRTWTNGLHTDETRCGHIRKQWTHMGFRLPSDWNVAREARKAIFPVLEWRQFSPNSGGGGWQCTCRSNVCSAAKSVPSVSQKLETFRCCNDPEWKFWLGQLWYLLSL